MHPDTPPYTGLLADAYDLIFDQSDYPAETAHLAELVRTANPAATSLLDVACGPGRHLLGLSEVFPDTAGVDLSERMVALARDRLPERVPVSVGDMRELDLGRRFDAVICLFGSVGYMREPTALNTAVARMAAHLNPGGVLIVEPWHTPAVFEETRIPVTARAADSAMTTLIVQRREGRHGIMDMHHVYARGFEVHTFREVHELGLFTDAEYRASFEAAGLDVRHDGDAPTSSGLYVGAGR
ncbi:class I SAM-dependent methyltransferase [Phytomonospora sp. NPDC050363]|uniref:class I SAM-dependent methyltransferase n=1 Tax=Phytomonospora sp. NPDC050363 TaxID=3155642 RepID=UPI0033C93726